MYDCLHEHNGYTQHIYFCSNMKKYGIWALIIAITSVIVLSMIATSQLWYSDIALCAGIIVCVIGWLLQILRPWIVPMPTVFWAMYYVSLILVWHYGQNDPITLSSVVWLITVLAWWLHKKKLIAWTYEQKVEIIEV